jgi:aspartyl-tRNA(Asn)/glutamyl-tRNA(Gln) amidotransferase subunit C
MAISLDELRQIADLARLKLSDSELDAMHADLNKVLEHFSQLQALQLAGADIAPHAVDLESVWDADETVDGMSREGALAGAPSTAAGLFLVPTIIE